MRVTIKKVGDRLAVFLPSMIVREKRLTEGAIMEIANSSDAIILRRHDRQRTRRPLNQILKKIKRESYRRQSAALAGD
jgi:antitoxin component of MazEF toxin-antitoxin module